MEHSCSSNPNQNSCINICSFPNFFFSRSYLLPNPLHFSFYLSPSFSSCHRKTVTSSMGSSGFKVVPLDSSTGACQVTNLVRIGSGGGPTRGFAIRRRQQKRCSSDSSITSSSSSEASVRRSIPQDHRKFEPVDTWITAKRAGNPQEISSPMLFGKVKTEVLDQDFRQMGMIKYRLGNPAVAYGCGAKAHARRGGTMMIDLSTWINHKLYVSLPGRVRGLGRTGD